ncbi:MAG: cyclic nucleotide-binding domain-containing protein [Magnetococcales bacterium]|nr:cyclic nucleotide-binding domain-containing protein [Magnetococcales bacterium]
MIMNHDNRELGRLYKQGDIIFRQGEFSDKFFMIRKGRVELTRESSAGKSMRVEIGDGEIFGIASAFTTNHERFATAKALEDSYILGIDEKMFVARMHQDPSIAFRLVRHLSQRLFDLEHGSTRIEEKGKKSAGSSKSEKGEKSDKKAKVEVASPCRKLPNVHDFSVCYHFLIVEDEIEFFSVIESWLANSVEYRNDPNTPTIYKLTHATSFMDAEQRLGQDKYDLILLDLNLGDSQGYEQTFVRMQAMAFDTPIIVFTGMDDDHQAIQAVDDGAQDYLIKGQVNRRTLVRAIQHALSRHKMQRMALEEFENHKEENGNKYAVMLRDWLHRCIVPNHEQVKA